MAKHGMVIAASLGMNDKIEVPVEVCIITGFKKIPGQLKKRSNHLIEITVSPISGPWAECEGKFIVESSELISLVERESVWAKRKAKWMALFNSLFTRTKVEPMALPQYPTGGPAT